MQNKISKGIIVCSMLASFWACNPKPETPPVVAIDKEAIKAEIQAREQEYADLYNSGEVRKIGYYADDAVTFFPSRKPIRGFEERAEFFKADLQSNTNRITFITSEVFPSSDGIMVVEIGAYTVSDSAKNVLSTGNYMSLFEKRDGKYVCLRDMSASDMPVQ